MSLLLKLTRAGAAPQVGRPAPEKLIAGDPVHTTWSVEEAEGLSCGLWQSTPGKWRVDYAGEWEYVHILDGVSILTGEDGETVTLRKGAGWIIRPGFKGTWECVETTLKEYVIRG